MAKRDQRGQHEGIGAVPAFAVYSAGVLALTDPGPAAAGVAVVAPDGPTISQRAYYLGHATQGEAAARALLAALRLSQSLGIAPVRLVVDQPALADLVTERHLVAAGDAATASAVLALLAQLPVVGVTIISPARNPARAVALAPLMQWLPERTRRAHALALRTIRPGLYEVASETQPGHFYRVHLPEPAAVARGEAIRCECADFQYRGLPCKHLLVAAAVAGTGRERLFYPEVAGGPAIPAGPGEAKPEAEGQQREAGGAR